MNEDIINAISSEDPVLHTKILKALHSIGTVASVCIDYEEGNISGKTGMDMVVATICNLEHPCMRQ